MQFPFLEVSLQNCNDETILFIYNLTPTTNKFQQNLDALGIDVMQRVAHDDYQR